MSKWKKPISMGILMVLVACVFARFHREMAIDKCLDGGSAWDYTNARCNKD